MAEPYDEAAATEMVEAFLAKVYCHCVGEAGSGKSCLLHQFTQNSFKEHSQHTIGVEFSSRTINIGEKRVKLQLWDTAGQERFRSVTRSYYRGAAACLLVYDITSRSSFLNLSRWLADARALGSSQLVTVLVGNKTDREEEREVEWSEASKWASENDVHFIETSSLTGDNIEKPFALAARAILLSIEGGQLDPEKVRQNLPTQYLPVLIYCRAAIYHKPIISLQSTRQIHYHYSTNCFYLASNDYHFHPQSYLHYPPCIITPRIYRLGWLGRLIRRPPAPAHCLRISAIVLHGFRFLRPWSKGNI
ncbi:unnamed protein product [Rhizoctonia solani]|nr:unnamed protein product [Rhizoctonia solani]